MTCFPMTVVPPFVTFLLSFFSLSYAKARVSRAHVVDHGTEPLDSYDFVIIVGGTSGLTVADRLTEDPESAT